MIKFIVKGVLRDRSRSLFPIIIVTVMVTIIVFFKGFAMGVMNQFVSSTAIVSSGHMKITTAAYQEESQLLPNDLALLKVNNIVKDLNQQFPEYFWTPRVTFAGLLDAPDENGETISQGPVIAFGIDFLSEKSRQIELWDLNRKLIEGRLPIAENEVLLSSKLANSLNLKPGSIVTFIGSTMHGAFTTFNFSVVGTFNLMMGATDRQMMLLDISGARIALDMENAASEILGYSNSLYYNDDEVVALRTQFNTTYNDSSDIFRPVMAALRDSNQLGVMVDLNDSILAILLGTFLGINMIVLWNMGLMNGLRRYGEIGMRLAIGQSKGEVYRSMIIEATIIGSIGTVLGTSLGLMISYYLQNVGIDYSEAFESLQSTSTLVIPSILRSHVTSDLYYIGFIPGVVATVLGTMLAGRAIYKREMAQLFKELET